MKLITFCIISNLFITAGLASSISIIEDKYSFFIEGGNTLYVGGSGLGNYSKIQYAIDNASNGDTIFVYDDSSPYYENVIVDKSIQLKGENTDTTIIDGSFNDNAVKINDVDEVNVSKFTIIHGNPYGILLEESSNSMLVSCNISNNRVGMHISHSSRNTLMNLKVSQNSPWGILFNYHSNNNTISHCNISNNGGELGDGVGIYLSSWSSYNFILHSFLSNNGIGPWNTGILLEYYANHTVISNCTVSYDGDEGIGICFGGIFCSSNHNVVSNCNISGGGDGISCVYSTNNTFINNQIWSTICGVCLSCSSDTDTLNCNIHHNSNGVVIYHSSNNTILNCNISYNDIGTRVQETANNNIIYHSNFFNNTQNAYDECNNDFWDNGYPSGGNYWSNYTGDDNNNDGIGDDPYNISGGDNQDRYPLMGPFGIDEEPPIVQITSPEKDFLYLMNHKILPFITTVIIGKIDVYVDAIDYIYGIHKVEFYIDGELKYSDTAEPYDWTWDERLFFKHTINVTAYDNAGNSASDEIMVRKFF